MIKTTDKLEALKQKQRQLAARIGKLEAREKATKRKEDTRLKVLVGAALLADATLNKETEETIRRVLPRAIANERDRDFLKGKGWL